MPAAQGRDLTWPADLHGTWAADGFVPNGPPGSPEASEGISWTFEVSLAPGKLVISGYPPWDETATVTKVERDGETVRLHVVDHVQNDVVMADGVLTMRLTDGGRTLHHASRELTRQSP